MVKMSDIFKRLKKEEKTEAPGAEEIATGGPASQTPRLESPKPNHLDITEEMRSAKSYFSKIAKVKTDKIEEEKPQASGIRISPIVTKETKTASSEECAKLYEETIFFMQELLKLEENVDYKSLETKTATEQIEKIVDQVGLGNKNLLMLALVKDSIDTNYLLCHSVNTCIYALTVGLAIGYEKSKLIELGVASLLHDIGMTKYLDLAYQPRKLTIKEYNEIKNHTIIGWQILKDINGLSKIVSDVVYQYHERIDGSGYPLGLKGRESINECAKIVGLIDVYEAMLHKRSYRNTYLPLKVAEEILNNKNAFEYELIKILIEKVGIFPIGNLVELSTKEIARVVKLNYEVSLRPVVQILYDASGRVPKDTQALDLTTQPTIFIKGGILRDELEAKLGLSCDKKNDKGVDLLSIP